MEIPITGLSSLPLQYLLNEGMQELQGNDTARLDTELLLCKVMQIDRSQIYSQPGIQIPADKIRLFRALLDKRNKGFPVAYLVEHKEFWSLELYVNEYTLVPRPETECLVETVLMYIPQNTTCSIVDLGTGCGAIALALASERSACNILAIENCIHALAVARLNAEHHGFPRIQFRRGNWFAGIKETFDIIVSNPPYISSRDEVLLRGDVAHEPVLALDGGRDGLDAIRKIIGRSVNHLNPGGRIFIEHGYDQGSRVRELLTLHGYTPVKTILDYAGLERVTFGQINRKQ